MYLVESFLLHSEKQSNVQYTRKSLFSPRWTCCTDNSIGGGMFKVLQLTGRHLLISLAIRYEHICHTHISEWRPAVGTIHRLMPLECIDLNMRFDSERCSMRRSCVPCFHFAVHGIIACRNQSDRRPSITEIKFYKSREKDDWPGGFMVKRSYVKH